MDDERMQDEMETTQSDTPTRLDFYGCYSHAIDAKGRIIVPNAYRAALGSVFTIGPTRDFKGVALYPERVYEAILAELNAMNQRKPVVQKYTMQFFKLSYRDMQADGQGRILLPPILRQRMLGDARDLEISGVSSHIRIVGAEKATSDDMDFMENIDDILEQIGNTEPS